MALRALPAEAASARRAAPADAPTGQQGIPTESSPTQQGTPAQPSTAQQGTTAQPSTTEEGAPAEATMALRAIPAQPPTRTTPPGLFAPPPGEPSAADVSLFDPATEADPATVSEPTAGTEGPKGRAGSHRGGRRNRRPTVVLAACAVVATIVAGAGFASGLFSYESPERDHASRQVRESVPDAWVETPTASAPTAAAPSYASSAPTTVSESPSPGADASPSASASESGTAEPSPSGSQEGNVPGTGPEPDGPTQTATTMRASAPAAPAPVLRRGDQGPEVTELQSRLGQLFLFPGKADGVFGRRLEKSVRAYQWSRGITADELGVYGPATRARLESETAAP
ncbi:peptidoglycan-binding protein [Streptomyces sp. NPDC056112]|uniref:peptidoglycan-binding domain-containing protein n=1 Tax=unclassified Streptomyces TaxID=2593676 RepID=UPI001CD3F81E|nr:MULTISPECIES: peptidoglycan-binding domain-containing protein [unclassified Streptomyces]